MVKFGLTLSNRGVVTGASTLDDMIALAQRADADERWDSIWVGDSILAKPRLDALTLMGALAVVTDRVKIGPACLPRRRCATRCCSRISGPRSTSCPTAAPYSPPVWVRTRPAAAT